MTDAIEITKDGRALFMGKQQAWHRLGDIKGRAFGEDDIRATVPELLMPVTFVPTYILWYDTDAIIPRESWVETPRMGAVVRADGKIVGEGLGKDSYGIVQPEDAFEWGKLIADHGGFPLVSAGSIREGRQFFFTYDVATVETGAGNVDNYLTVYSSHDGSSPLGALHSSIIVVCANTLAMAQASAKDRTTLKHTSNVEERMRMAIQALKDSIEHTKLVSDQINQLVTIQVREFKPLVDGLLPVIDTPGRSATMRQTAREAVLELLRSPVTEGAENTGWAFVQAVNTYENWIQTVRGVKGRNPDTVRAERQFDAMLKGSQPLTDKAVKLVLAGV